MSINPVISNLPATTTALTNKYTTGSLAAPQQSSVLAALNALPLPRPASQSNTITPLLMFDLARANRGMMPLTARQSAAAARTLATGKPATPPRRQGFFRSALGDLRALVSGIPKLPQAIYNEAKDLPDALAQVPSAIAEGGGNPLQALGNVANLPGFRMVPGAFVAGAFGDEGQGAQQLLAHPLFTALDLLPVASGAAKTTRVARTASEAYAGQVEALVAARKLEGFTPDTAFIPPRPRPLQTALTRRLDESGNVIPNAFGRGIAARTEDFAGTSLGNSLQATFRERGLSRAMNRADRFVRESVDPNIPTSALQPPVPGGSAAMIPELDIRDLGVDIARRHEQFVGKPLSPESRDFFRKLALSEADGTPIAPERNALLTPDQQSLARDIRDHTYKTRDYTDALPGPQSTGSVLIDGVRETYDYNTYKLISRAQSAESLAREMVEARQAALATADSPSPLTVAELDNRISRLATRADIPSEMRRDLTQLYTAAKENSTFNLRDEIARAIPVIKTVDYKTISRLVDNLENGRWGPANRGLRALSRTTKGAALPINLEEMQARIGGLIAHERALSRTTKFTDKHLEKLTRDRVKVENRYNPARFDPLIQRAQREAIGQRVRERFSADPDLDILIRLADEGLYDKLISKDPEFARVVRQEQVAARETWKTLRDAGHDPIFFQRVTPQQATRQRYARVSDKPMTLQATRRRMMDATPYIEDAGIIVTQAGLDIMSRRAIEAALTDVANHVGRTRSSILAEYEERLLRYPVDSPIPLRTRADQMLARRWAPWNPGQFTGRGSSTFNVEGANTIYVPRAVAENLKRLYEPPLPKLTAAFDPILNVFRTSVLPLSVAWQLNNAVSGVIITSITDPLAFRELPNVLSRMRAERKGPLPAAAERIHMPGAPPPGIGSMDPEMLRWQKEVKGLSPVKERIATIAATAQWGSGKALENWYSTARESRIAKITDPAKKLLEKSYGYNQFVDDMWRSMIGESAKKRAIRQGFTPDAADALAVQSIRRVFQAWDEMTPMERSVMRSIVPFYGFAAYATKFAMRYPLDHPFRVSVLGSLTRAELSDAMTGLPEYIRDMILLGDPRANKTVRALNISPFNPFGGVPSMFTVAGFLGQLNPVITGALESVGVNVQQGGPQLYPELRYDPETGRLVADPSGNIASNILGNISPQLQGITSLLGWNDQFNETLERDPAAAGRMLLSNFRLPVLFRQVNVGDQLIKSEMARFEDQENARREALRTGNLGVLNDFPGLAAYGEQVRALDQSGQLDAMRPAEGTEGQPGIPSRAGVAYAAQAALLGSNP